MNIDLKQQIDNWVNKTKFKIKNKHWKEAIYLERLSKPKTDSGVSGSTSSNNK